MSLVNDMLRDLEKRKAAESDSDTTSGVTRESMIEPRQSGLKKKDLVSGLLLIIVVLLLAYIFLSEKTPETIIASDKPVESAISSSESVTDKLENKSSTNDQGSFHQHTDTQIKKAPIETEAKVNKAQRPVEQKAKDKSVLVSQVEKKAAASPKPVQVKNVPPKAASHKAVVSKKTNKESTALNARQTNTQSREKAKPAKVVGKPPVNSSEKSLSEKPKKVDVPAQSEGALDDVSQATPEVKPLKVALSPSALDLKTASDAISLFELGKADEAYALLRSFIAENDIKVKSSEVLANRLLQDQRYSELSDLMEKSGRPMPQGLRQVKARWLLIQGKPDLALALMEDGQADINSVPEYYALLASLYQRNGQSGKAFEQYSQLIQTNDTIADWWAGLGIAADQLGQGRQAAFAYQQALSLPGLNRGLNQYIRQRSAALSGIR